jgi:hypothetical protein
MIAGSNPDEAVGFFGRKKIHNMPSCRGEVKPFAPCRRFAAYKKTPGIYVEVGIAGKIYRPFLAQFRPSLREVSHVAWRGAPLEMVDGTKGGAQRASSLRSRCVGEVDPETATHICLSSTEVKERAELYLYFASGPSLPVLEWNLPLPLVDTYRKLCITGCIGYMIQCIDYFKVVYSQCVINP